MRVTWDITNTDLSTVQKRNGSWEWYFLCPRLSQKPPKYAVYNDVRLGKIKICSSMFVSSCWSINQGKNLKKNNSSEIVAPVSYLSLGHPGQIFADFCMNQPAIPPATGTQPTTDTTRQGLDTVHLKTKSLKHQTHHQSPSQSYHHRHESWSSFDAVWLYVCIYTVPNIAIIIITMIIMIMIMIIIIIYIHIHTYNIIPRVELPSSPTFSGARHHHPQRLRVAGWSPSWLVAGHICASQGTCHLFCVYGTMCVYIYIIYIHIYIYIRLLDTHT